jgi:hypothetical protein
VNQSCNQVHGIGKGSDSAGLRNDIEERGPKFFFVEATAFSDRLVTLDYTVWIQ